ncbi:MAG: hypothetical protein N4A31_02925 [Rickettsiales bacterium]|jgi:hypothetical protein|nr:hypothetical protein [Rickettsiales bacterium]
MKKENGDIDETFDDMEDTLDYNFPTSKEVDEGYKEAARKKKEDQTEIERDRKQDFQEEIEKREKNLKESISNFNTQIDDAKSVFKEEEARRSRDEEGDILFNISPSDETKNKLGVGNQLKNLQIKEDTRRKTDLKDKIKGIKKQKKIQKTGYIKEQADLGKQIRQDRIARWSRGKFGKFSDKTREELREIQKMLGRVIRSDQRTGVIDKVVQSASNLKKKLLKGKSR